MDLTTLHSHLTLKLFHITPTNCVTIIPYSRSRVQKLHHNAYCIVVPKQAIQNSARVLKRVLSRLHRGTLGKDNMV